MKIILTVDPEDGTGPLTKVRTNYAMYSYSDPADALWYDLVMMMKEIIHTWCWRRAGKPQWEEKEKRLAWKDEARTWTAPIDRMIAAAREKDGE